MSQHYVDDLRKRFIDDDGTEFDVAWRPHRRARSLSGIRTPMHVTRPQPDHNVDGRKEGAIKRWSRGR